MLLTAFPLFGAAWACPANAMLAAMSAAAVTSSRRDLRIPLTGITHPPFLEVVGFWTIKLYLNLRADTD